MNSLRPRQAFVQGAYCRIPYMKKSSYVYFVQSEDGFIKIGCTQNLKSRIRHIQIYNHMKIRLIGKVKGGHDVEAKLHKKFKKHRKRGERFNPAPELLEYISTHKIYKGKSIG